MITKAKARTLTLDQFLRRPETKPAREFEDGEVSRKTMPDTWHGYIQGLLGFFFRLYLREHGGGEGGSELRCVFGPPGGQRTYVPDFVYIAGAPPAFGPTRGPWRGAPDLAVEILSPDDRMTRVNRKLAFYLLNGVRMVWLIDPDNRTITVITSLASATVLRDGDALTGGDLLPGFSVAVRELLPPRQPDASPIEHVK